MNELDNYTDLLAAVYRQAVKDDCANVKAKAHTRLNKLGIRKQEASAYIDKNSDYIKSTVRKNVYQEYQNWGDGQLTKRMQCQYIAELVDDLVDNYGQ